MTVYAYACQDECEGRGLCVKYCGNTDRCLSVAMPYDKREHVNGRDCWCEPKLDFTDPDTGIDVWAHNHPQ